MVNLFGDNYTMNAVIYSVNGVFRCTFQAEDKDDEDVGLARKKEQGIRSIPPTPRISGVKLLKEQW